VRVLQLELPRELSVTVRPWRRDLFAALAGCGVAFDQADLNLPFWRLVLDDAGCDTVGRLLDLHHQGSAFNAALLKRCVERASRWPVAGGHWSVQGLQLAAEHSGGSAALLDWVQADATRRTWAPWLARLDVLADAEVVAFSVGSLDELALAVVVADHLRRTRPAVHTCLAHHRWENFSLAPRLERLVRAGALLDLFDSVVLREDRAGQALAGLCTALRSGQLDALESIAIRIDGQPRLLPSRAADPPIPVAPLDGTDEEAAIGRYLASTTVPASRVLMVEALVRNDCHYGKCTFCVQNIGYPKRQQYRLADDLPRAATLVRHLAQRHGVRAFTFVDQAVHPNMLQAVCSAFEEQPLPIRWCVRMLPEFATFDATFLQRLAAAGCSDILLGLESIDPGTLAAMGKRHAFHGESAHAFLAACAEAGIDVTLSAIRRFPSEPAATYGRTDAFLRECEHRHANVTIIRNDFVLFEGSAIARDPQAFGIAAVHPLGGDLEFTLDYVDVHGRRGSDAGAPPPVPRDEAFLHYGSFGLLHRWRTGRTLPQELASGRAGEPFPAGRDVLLLGSNGYLGRLVAERLDADRLVLSSRSPSAAVDVAAPFVSQDLEQGLARLAALRPATVWVTARPDTGDFARHAAHLAHLQMLLDGWATAGSLRRLVVFSTQLVAATPPAGERVNGRSRLAPEAAYDCAKAQLEVFAGYLARAHRLSIDVVRLPLLWGGKTRGDDVERQLLHRWHRDLSQGWRWDFAPGDEAFGNSWVHMEDLVAALQPDAGPGLRVRTASSGDFTYAQLQAQWADGEPGAGQLQLPRSAFFLEDELGLPRRGLPG
jgi:nucleoside-diphosphate-sugar epimerase